MNRLTDIYLGNTHSQIVYDPLGRMASKKADGQTVFTNASFAATQGQPARPHAMKSAETYTVFPKHYVYHKYSNNLYFYDVWVNNYFIRKINKANDLYRNLGF